MDQVLILRVLAEKVREFNAHLYLCFADLRKASDSVNRPVVYKAWYANSMLIEHDVTSVVLLAAVFNCLSMVFNGDGDHFYTSRATTVDSA